MKPWLVQIAYLSVYKNLVSNLVLVTVEFGAEIPNSQTSFAERLLDA